MKPEEWFKEHLDSLYENISTLISFPSISKKTNNPTCPFGQANRNVLDAALRMGATMGFVPQNHENYCGSLLWKGDLQEEIGIFCHLDVVPEGNGWSIDPYRAVIKDDYIMGRGSADNKGPTILILYALMYLQEIGWKPKHTIRVFLGCNEEFGMEDITYFVQHHPMPIFSFTPDAAFPVCHGEKGIIQLEATYPINKEDGLISFKAGIASNSVPSEAECTLAIPAEDVKAVLPVSKDIQVSVIDEITCRIEVKGIAAHAAFPEGSNSALVKLAKLLLLIPCLGKNIKALMESLTTLFSDYYGKGLNIPFADEISGKTTHVGGMCEIRDGKYIQNINIRYAITSSSNELSSRIKQQLEKMGFSIVNYSDNPPMYVPVDHPVVQKLNSIVSSIIPGVGEPYVMGGGTYARKLENAVGFGPGLKNGDGRFGTSRGRAHQPDEYFDTNRLEKGFLVYIQAIPAIDDIICNSH